MAKRPMFGVCAMVLVTQLARAADSGAPESEPERERAHLQGTLSFVFGDDAIGQRPAPGIGVSPAFDAVDRPGYNLIFDGRAERDLGRENLAEISWEARGRGYLPGVETSAAFRLRVDWDRLTDANGLGGTPFEDAGSFVRVGYAFDANAEQPPRLSLTAYPLDTDRVRLGDFYDLTWGGTNLRRHESVFPNRVGPAPGAVLEWSAPHTRWFLGFKTARIPTTDDATGARVAEANYGLLVGTQNDFFQHLRVDVGLGGFEQGRFDWADVRGARSLVVGAQVRVLVHDHLPELPRFGLFSLRRAPLAGIWRASGFAWGVSAEASAVWQRVKSFDEPGIALFVPERAAVVQGCVVLERLWLLSAVEYRDLAYVLRNVPGFIPFASLPRTSRAQPELTALLELGYRLEELGLVPSIELGLRLPAAVESAGSAAGTAQSVVVNGPIDYAPLALGARRAPILETRAALGWEASSLIDAWLWMQYTHDPNRAQSIVAGTLGNAPLAPSGAGFLGLGLGIRAKF